jgi:hypothetical protein
MIAWWLVMVEIRAVFELLPTIFLLLIIIVSSITIVYVYRQYTIIKRLLDAQALKRGGIIEKKYPKRILTFPYHDFKVVVWVQQGSKYNPPETNASIMLHKLVPSKISIYYESLASRIGKALGTQDIQVGNEEFDQVFMIKGSDEIYVTNLVNLPIQQKLLDMQHLKPHIHISGTTLEIYVDKALTIEEEYDHLIDLSTAFVDRLQELY